jgi:hypothetical protein
VHSELIEKHFLNMRPSTMLYQIFVGRGFLEKELFPEFIANLSAQLGRDLS